MAYSGLTVLPTIQSIADDGSQFTIEDATVYNPSSGNPTYPSFSDTKRFWLFREVPFSSEANLSAPFLPETQPSTDPFVITCSLLDEFGVPFPDKVYEGLLIVCPAATDLDALRDSIIADGIDFWLLYAQENWGLGSVVIFVNTTSTACLNDTMMNLNDIWPGECSQDAYKETFVLFQGVVYQGALAQPMPITSEESVDEYATAQATLDVLLDRCDDPNCDC